MHFFFDFGSRWVLPEFPGAPWDPLGPSRTLWDPLRESQRVQEGELKSEFNGKVARNNGPSNFPIELRPKFFLWDPLGLTQGGPRGS